MNGGSDCTLSDWLVDTLESVMPHLIKARTMPKAIPSIEALKAQIAADVRETHFQVVGPAQICAWVRL
jgi:hypothetical protein